MNKNEKELTDKLDQANRLLDGLYIKATHELEYARKYYDELTQLLTETTKKVSYLGQAIGRLEGLFIPKPTAAPQDEGDEDD